MRERVWLAGVLVALSVLISVDCASVTVHRAKSADTPGVRFYRPAPYLVVTQAAKESADKEQAPLQFSILWLPDYKEEYVIETKGGLGSIAFNPTLSDGWNLTGLNATVDSKAAELLTSVVGLIPKAGLTSAPPQMCPGIYKLEHRADGTLVPLLKPEDWDRAAVVKACGAK